MLVNPISFYGVTKEAKERQQALIDKNRTLAFSNPKNRIFKKQLEKAEKIKGYTIDVYKSSSQTPSDPKFSVYSNITKRYLRNFKTFTGALNFMTVLSNQKTQYYQLFVQKMKDSEDLFSDAFDEPSCDYSQKN